MIDPVLMSPDQNKGGRMTGYLVIAGVIVVLLWLVLIAATITR